VCTPDVVSLRSAIVVAGLVFMLGGALSWGGPPPNIVQSDTALHNTARGTNALQSNTTGEYNTV